MEQDEAAWLTNLEAARIDWLVVASLPWNERVNHRHSREGFVVEEAWARGQPERFVLRFANSQVRIFELGGGPPRPTSRPGKRSEVDAVELYLRAPELVDQLYPGARAFIEQSRLRDYALARARSGLDPRRAGDGSADE
jgi:hypothetical protein